MKKYLYSFAMFTVLTVCQAFADHLKTNEWGAVTNNFQMSINFKGEKNEIKTNQPLCLLIYYKNVSTNQTFRVYRANAIECDPGYSFVVISPSGKDISSNTEKIAPSESGGFVSMVPSQIIECEFNLSRLYKFDEIGTYNIIVKKAIWSPKSQKVFTVISNPLNVVVSN
jgi:hypothetical protein